MQRDAHDLSFVAPERRAEVMRRIEAVERFLLRPGRRAAESIAAELGISAFQFYNLVKAWKATRRPEAIAGSGRPRIKPSAVTAEQSAIIEMAAQSTTRPHEAIARAIEIGRERGLAMPQIGALRRHFERVRPRRLPEAFTAAGDALVLDACAIDLPVEAIGIGSTRPIMAGVIDAIGMRLIGVSLSVQGFGPSLAAAAMLDAIDPVPPALSRTGGRPIRLTRWSSDGQDWRQFDGALNSAGIDVTTLEATGLDRSRAITGLLGTRHAGLTLLPRLTLENAARRAATRPSGETMGEDVAKALIRGRFVGYGKVEGSLRLEDMNRRVLIDGLTGLIDPAG